MGGTQEQLPETSKRLWGVLMHQQWDRSRSGGRVFEASTGWPPGRPLQYQAIKPRMHHPQSSRWLQGVGRGGNTAKHGPCATFLMHRRV